jgi:hypothetical protein
MEQLSEFTEVQRPFDSAPTLLHKSAPAWVVNYPATLDRAEHWQAYRAVAPVPAGRMPWTVDNRRIGSDRGFPSIEAAVAACEAFVASQLVAV